MNKKSLDALSGQIPALDNYGSGSIRVICKTHEEVIKTITLLVNTNVLDNNNSLGQSPRISIQKTNKNSVNDSVNEGKRNDIERQYIEPNKIKVPRQQAKLDLILKINAGEVERTPEAIRAYLDSTGLWKDRTEAQTQMDVNLIMRKTDKGEEISGEFITDFIYSPYTYDAGEFASPFDAAKKHVKWLVTHGLEVSIEEKRYSFFIYVKYNNKRQFDDLCQWMGWHSGFTDTPNNKLNSEDRQYFEEVVKSGKKTTFR